MIADFPAGNGRCVDGVTINFLLFDSEKRPVPWTIDTHLPKHGSDGKMSAFLRDFSRTGHAELIATACKYSEPPRFGEDRSIAGVYQAIDAHWKLLQSSDLKPYVSVLSRNYGSSNAEPEKWIDWGNATPTSDVRQIEKITPAAQVQRNSYPDRGWTSCHSER